MCRLNRWLLALSLLILGGAQAHAQQTVSVQYDPDDPLVAFAVGDLESSLGRAGHTVVSNDADLEIKFDFFTAGMGPQSFRIQREGNRAVRIIAGDSLGAMYGALELAEQIALGGGLKAVREMARKPYILRRGLKFNIPLDGRTPSYDDTGTAAQENIAVMWDFEFWRHFLDTMARNRYNVLSLWTTNPYAGIVKLPKYPGVNFDDVGRVTQPITPETGNHFQAYDLFDPANHKIIKRITLDEKIDYWTRVFDYAERRGIEIYMFHWNIFLWNAIGKHGVTYDQDNPKSIEYQRYCISQFLETYPQIDGIGVSAGEHVNRKGNWRIGIEEWLYHTYGLGVLDALKDDPGRRLRFIFRHLWSDLSKSAAAFKDYDVPFNTSHKYARARIYSTTTSPYVDFEYRDKLEETEVPCWLNLRNDDVYAHRWGDADHVREFLQNVPRDVMKHEAGFYMGPDSYVWGKEFIAKDPDLAGQWEVDKHWYRFMLWGRLGYDLTLTRDYFEQRLHRRYPEVNAATLYDTWAAASRIIPQVNKFFFRVNDLQFAPEGCMAKSGFLTVDASFFAHPPLEGSGILSVQEYAKARTKGEPFDGITPMEVADTLNRLAGQALDGVQSMRSAGSLSKELAATITDVESMACLGRYYADKIRGAAELAVYREDKSRTQSHQLAVQHLQNAVREWEAYTRVAAGQYKPQLLSRTHYLDWEKLLEEVRKEAESVAAQR
ncbi:MAG: hypothetical protein ACYTG0_02060 [Planctomycetota bacterium]|jgi:hypothetical protein